MLLWFNGPFGGGKTATAYELNRRLPGSVVCDSEHEEALTEIDEAIADGEVPSRPRRLERAGQKLMSALKGVAEFAAPLAQLTATIAQLLGKP
jgi:tRNA A37 N6-isopentenylltransferase MiaA